MLDVEGQVFQQLLHIAKMDRDTLYFNNPVPMFRGNPRTPWIDVQSEKLIQRHLSIVIFENYLKKQIKVWIEFLQQNFWMMI